MAAHYLTRLELGNRFLLGERQTVRVNAHGPYCKQSYGEFKIQNSRFQKLYSTISRLIPGFRNLQISNLESQISNLESGILNLES